ncbi:hypothetical protein G6L90_21040 [Agrobacterium tumefaciens]|uniref:hypothetical protein n=1 Tax=Agrobacterium tumefaciens TaxID=358 RepID=UPI0015725FE0|nr:hypothetical protein [Agrobacterium tumefaciens]WHO24116.1 hypothetical protein G6L90_21040 [Agrobacterium tumefaciens]
MNTVTTNAGDTETSTTVETAVTTAVDTTKVKLRGALDHWDTKKISITFPPSPREVYWIGTFIDSLEPEFTGYHQGIILSGAKTLHDASEHVVFVPITSNLPANGTRGKLPPYIHKLERSPAGDGRNAWAICNHVMTVRLSRLERFHGSDQSGNYRLKVPKISTSDFSAVLDCVANGIVVLRDRFKAHQEHALAELREKHVTEMKQIKAEHVTETQAAIEAYLEELTRPSAA